MQATNYQSNQQDTQTPSRYLRQEKIVPAQKARQGRWGFHVLVVLIAGMALAAVAWFIAESAV